MIAQQEGIPRLGVRVPAHLSEASFDRCGEIEKSEPRSSRVKNEAEPEASGFLFRHLVFETLL